jgi:hypothetical protein
LRVPAAATARSMRSSSSPSAAISASRNRKAMCSCLLPAARPRTNHVFNRRITISSERSSKTAVRVHNPLSLWPGHGHRT